MEAAPRLFRVVLEVSDLERTAGWYARLLGVTGRDVRGERYYFDCGGVILAVHDPHGKAPRPIPQDLYFATDDLEALHARARELGCLSKATVHGEPAGQIVRRPRARRPSRRSHNACSVSPPEAFLTGARRDACHVRV